MPSESKSATAVNIICWYSIVFLCLRTFFSKISPSFLFHPFPSYPHIAQPSPACGSASSASISPSEAALPRQWAAGTPKISSDGALSRQGRCQKGGSPLEFLDFGWPFLYIFCCLCIICWGRHRPFSSSLVWWTIGLQWKGWGTQKIDLQKGKTAGKMAERWRYKRATTSDTIWISAFPPPFVGLPFHNPFLALGIEQTEIMLICSVLVDLSVVSLRPQLCRWSFWALNHTMTG